MRRLTIFIGLAVAATSLAPAAARDIECQGRKATIVGTPDDDWLKGTIGDDVIYGRGGNDRIRGIGGNDVLCGGNGDDHVDGGPGSDFVFGEGGDDVLGGGDGRDTLRGHGGNDEVDGGEGLDTYGFHEADGPVDVDLKDRVATGEGTDSLFRIQEVFGSPYGGTLRGSDGHNVFWTLGPGDYTIEGRGGSDDIYGQETAGTLILSGGLGDDFIESLGGGDDDLNGGPDDDKLFSADGNDTLDGDFGDDVLIEGRGTNQLFGGKGIDTLHFDYHHSGMEVDLEAGTVMGDGMTATISSVENVFGTLYEDSLTGDAFGNGLVGGRGDDFIDGRDGNDYLDGGPHEDELHGGNGDDRLTGGVRRDYLGHNQGDGDPDDLFADDGYDECYGYSGDELESCETIVVE
jgi:Ca2+-binding RTX toxin-like protein